MSAVSQSQESQQSSTQDIVIDPASKDTIFWMGACYLALAVIFFYLVIAAWPVLVTDLDDNGKEVARTFRPFNILGVWCYWAPDRQMLFIAILAGAIGSLGHVWTSFGDYVGNKQLSSNWVWFFILRIPIGMALALLFYFIIRGGLIIPTVQVQSPSVATNPSNATLYVNAYSIAAFSALAGMFSKQATDKLAAIFDVVFAMKKPVERDGALGSNLSITLTPPKLIKGKQEDLTITGSGFSTKTEARINNKKRTFKPESDTKGVIVLEPGDVANTGKLEVELINPNLKATIEVVEAGGAKPVITTTDPTQLTAANQSVTIIGQELANCTITVNGNARKPTAAENTKLVVPLAAADFAPPNPLKLVVTNQGVGSDEISVPVR